MLQEAPKARESLVIMTLQDLSTEGRAEGALALGTGAAQRLNRHGWTWGSPQPESKHRIPLAPTEADGVNTSQAGEPQGSERLQVHATQAVSTGTREQT